MVSKCVWNQELLQVTSPSIINNMIVMCIREDSDSLQWQSWPGSGLGS